ncbi:MAG TPA: PepSY-associated TM helix domain-containing protein [Bryobacteraceae bacterium]|nr:PepSY-associated TM helix domain-containing protein [Bryobacteraceae bacterium]
MYKTLRTIHLICGALSLPFLLMYVVSAVQMAHSKWFSIKPAVEERHVDIPQGLDARQLARNLTAKGIRGELSQIKATPGTLTFRIVVPGKVHEISTDRASNTARIKTSTAGALGMMNRLHHAAGLYHDYIPLNIWGLAVTIVSLSLVGLGATGLWMWWLRRQERITGILLVAANLVFTVAILAALRAAGP